MRKTLLQQYNHTWKMFYLMVNEFDTNSWLKTGCSYIIPARISYHIIGGVNYYIENDNKISLLSGKENNWDWEKAPTDDLPTKEDIIELIHVYKIKTENWINSCNFEAENNKFGWTGTNQMSVVIFLLRHMEYHIGELNLLLHMSKDDSENDNWVKALDDFKV